MANPKDEYDEDDIDTAVSRPRKSKASPRPKSAKKHRPSSSKGLPYKSGAASGSNSTHTARELWLSAVRSNTALANSHKKGNLGKKTPTEYWSNTLRLTGAGFSSNNNMDSFSGLKGSQTRNMGYGSTSHYMRQKAGTERTGTSHDSQAKPLPGTPAYKSREEYYDEVLALKKQIQALNVENSTQKSKVRRLEEDNIKKEKEIDQLLDPSKSEDLRRTLSDRRPDTSTVIHSLKQKILKLEHQLKERETAFSKLQSDLKTTKHEEMKIQLEMLYKEIVRLNQMKTIPQDSQLDKSSNMSTVKETPSRLKALQDTIKRMNEKNVRLMSESKTLKEDLQKMMEDKASVQDKHREYEDMSKKELMGTLTKLEKRLDRAEADNFSITSDMDNKRGETEGKIVLEGTVAQRLDQLDKRETELLEELNKQKSVIKRLKEDRVHYRKKNDEKEREIKTLKKEIEELQAELDGFYDKDRSGTPRRTPRTKTPPPRPRSRSGSLGSDRERIKMANALRENNSAKKIQRKWRTHSKDVHEKEHRKRVEDFTENHAARRIQKGWKDGKDQKEKDIATELIQGAIRGHRSRQSNMSRMRGFMAEPDDIDDTSSMNVTATESELEDAADTIQTGIRGYQYRKHQIQRRPPSRSSISRASPTKRLDSEGEEESDETPPPSARRLSGFSGRATPSFSGRNTPLSMSGRAGTPLSLSGRATTPLSMSGRAASQLSLSGRKGSTSGRETPVSLSGRNTPKLQQPSSARSKLRTPTPALDDSDSDDDDDIVMPTRKSRLF